MIRSFVFSDGNVVGEDLELEALRLVRADKGLHIWVDLDQPTPDEVQQVLVNLFDFHPLTVEDVLSETQFPKVEDFGDYLYLVMHAVDYSKQDKFTTTELDMFIGKEFLVTHHTARLMALESTITRIRQQRLIRAKTIDRVAYRIVDGLVENYQPMLAEFSMEIQALEDQIFTGKTSNREVIEEFRQVRRDVAHLQQIVRPQQEVVARIAHGEFKIIRPYLLPYFRDVNDSLRRIAQETHGFIEQLFLSMDIYLNKAANETNEVIKLLTVLTALTTPATLVGTWYGMNFQDIPEYGLPYAYPVASFVTVSSTVLLLAWLKFKRWI